MSDEEMDGEHQKHLGVMFHYKIFGFVFDRKLNPINVLSGKKTLNVFNTFVVFILFDDYPKNFFFAVKILGKDFV